MFPKITIAIVAWPRYRVRIDYLRKVLDSINKYLPLQDVPVSFLVSAESQDVTQELKAEFLEVLSPLNFRVNWKETSPDLGENYNVLYSLCETPYALMFQEDQILTGEVDLAKDLEFLETHLNYAYIRYGYCYNEWDPPFEQYPHLCKQLKTSAWNYGDEPQLIRLKVFKDLGPFWEKVTFGDHEHEFGGRIVRSTYDVALRVPKVSTHIGTYSTLPSRWPTPNLP